MAACEVNFSYVEAGREDVEIVNYDLQRVYVFKNGMRRYILGEILALAIGDRATITAGKSLLTSL